MHDLNTHVKHSILPWAKFVLSLGIAYLLKILTLQLMNSWPGSGYVSYIVSILLYNLFGPLSVFAIILAVFVKTESAFSGLLHGLFVVILDWQFSTLISIYHYFKQRYKLRIKDKDIGTFKQYQKMIAPLISPPAKPSPDLIWTKTNQPPIYIAQALMPRLHALLSSYVFSKYRSEFYVESDAHQVPGSRAIYGDTFMESLLATFQPIVEHHTGLQLWPTYSTCRVYQQGQSLPKHRDRCACEVTVSICLYCDEHQKTNQCWPLFIESNTDQQQIKHFNLNPGDALIYNGRLQRHWREPLAARKQIQVLLHYVDQNGAYAKYKYDLRQGLAHSELSALDYQRQESA